MFFYRWNEKKLSNLNTAPPVESHAFEEYDIHEKFCVQNTLNYSSRQAVLTEGNSFVETPSTDSNVSSEDKNDNTNENAEKNSTSQISTETIGEIDNRAKEKENLVHMIRQQGEVELLTSDFLSSLPSVLCLLFTNLHNGNGSYHHEKLEGLIKAYNLEIVCDTINGDNFFKSAILSIRYLHNKNVFSSEGITPTTVCPKRCKIYLSTSIHRHIYMQYIYILMHIYIYMHI